MLVDRRAIPGGEDPSALAMTSHLQDVVQARSLNDPESFWRHQADQLEWHRQPSSALTRSTKKLANGIEHPSFSWFPNGEISTCYNCVDRHVKAGNGHVNAIIWDSPVTETKERYTYKQLLTEVEALAGVLREEGVRKGDVVLVYSMLEVSSHDQ
jgi:propionyl-CoA synthetase